MADPGSSKRAGEPQEGPAPKRALRSSDSAAGKKPAKPIEPVEPYQLPVDVDAILPSEGLSLPGFSEEVYTQDVFAIFAANPANKPRLAEIHTGWFNCRGPSLEELWASRYPSGGTYQQTLPNASLRKVVTLQQLLEVASEIPLIRRLRLLLLDHLVLMGVIFTKWDLPLHHFPDFETRIRSLIEALGPQAPLASDTGSIGAAGGLTTSKMANVSPEIRARIQNLRVDPKMVTSLDSISGNVPAKKAIKSNIFLASSLPHLVMEGLGSRGILLHGPPGTGKTLLALASATQSEKYTVYSALSSDLIVKWQGSSEQNIAGLFAIAQENAPAAIFIDEVEGLCQSRTSTSYDGNLHRISNVFLASMTMAKGVVLIGTTNLPWRLNQAFGRRFRTKVHVGLPSEDDRRSIVQRRLISFNHSLSESDVVDFAKSCKNFTGDVVTQSINAALEELAEEIESATHFRPLEVNGRRMHCPCGADDKGATKRTYEELEQEGLANTVTTRELTPAMLEASAEAFKAEVWASQTADLKHNRWSNE